MSNSFFIGWDVGAWMSNDGDALWILDRDGNTFGTPWHGNLGRDLRAADSAESFIDAVFVNCKVQRPTGRHAIAMAIDAPLAFADGFVKLLVGTSSPEHLEDALGNPYLFRRTERYAASFLGRNPLSPLQDQIGSQTTKILHFLAKFGLKNNQLGVWLGSAQGTCELSVIEAYPAMCKQNGMIRPQMVANGYSNQLANHPIVTADEKDALLCAIIAQLHATDNNSLHQPEGDWFHPDEGWIWFPKF
jgi:hypothetical protein